MHVKILSIRHPPPSQSLRLAKSLGTPSRRLSTVSTMTGPNILRLGRTLLVATIVSLCIVYLFLPAPLRSGGFNMFIEPPEAKWLVAKSADTSRLCWRFWWVHGWVPRPTSSVGANFGSRPGSTAERWWIHRRYFQTP